MFNPITLAVATFLTWPGVLALGFGLAAVLPSQPPMFVDDRPCDEPQCARVAFRQVKSDTIIALTYPAGPVPTHVCSELFQYGDDAEIGRHCWVPKDPRFELDVWEDLTYKGHYFNVEVWRADGTYVLLTPLPDSVYEQGKQPVNCGDDCP